MFADNQVHGRMGPMLMKALSAHIHSATFTPDISDKLSKSLSRLKDRISYCSGREIRAVWNEPFVYSRILSLSQRTRPKGLLLASVAWFMTAVEMWFPGSPR